jgi:hypothetical protein
MNRTIHSISVLLLALTAAANTGCTTLNLSSVSPILGTIGKTNPKYSGVATGVELMGSDAEKAYKAVREAKSKGGIVLHLVGDQEPVRVLPLPRDGKTVFVSDLLRQSGVQRRLGRVDATLYRASPHSISGVRMSVQLDPDTEAVLPESDYALEVGDRLQVQKAAALPMKGFVSALLGV